MKVLLINGSPNKQGCTNEALGVIARTLSEEGVESETAWIGRDALRGCQACMACKRMGENRCVFGDDVVNGLIEAASRADGIIVGSPVYYAGMNGGLMAVLDRMFYAGGSVMAFKPAAAVASARRAGTTPTIDQINKYFQINCMPVVPSTYWPMVHGSKPEDVHRDEEGVQTMENLARNMAWMLHAFAAAKEAGIDHPFPVREARTNFVR